LISRNHYTREAFWEIYNEPNYYSVKDKTDPQRLFSDLFEKFHSVGKVRGASDVASTRDREVP
jgi:hypothetical protein